MKYSLLNQMVCPYCEGSFSISNIVTETKKRLINGVVSCNCFNFPVIDSVLLLNLDRYHPPEHWYSSLQAAAISSFTGDGKTLGLEYWIKKFAPALGAIIYEAQLSLIDCMTFERNVNSPFERQQQQTLRDMAESSLLTLPIDNEHKDFFHFWDLPWEVTRQFEASANIYARQVLNTVDLNGWILSLCCGKGFFENHSRFYIDTSKLVCVDRNPTSVFLTKRFYCPDANYIVADVQHPLPFHSGTFDGVFSSTFLPEVPTQASVIREAIRVTKATGWTLFDSIWNGPQHKRIDCNRVYRLCQNFFTSLDQYLDIFLKYAQNRDLHWFMRHHWDFDPGKTVLQWRQGTILSRDEIIQRNVNENCRVINFLVGKLLHTQSTQPLPFDQRQIEHLRVPGYYKLEKAFPQGWSAVLRKEMLGMNQLRSYPRNAPIERGRLNDSMYLTELFSQGILQLGPAGVSKTMAGDLGPSVKELLNIV